MKQIISLFLASLLLNNFITAKTNAQWVFTNGPSGTTVYAMAVKENYIFAGTENNGVYYSTNNGINWFETALKTGSIRCLVVDGTDIYAGISGGVSLSWDNGNSWVGRSLNGTVYSLAVGGGKVFAGTGNIGGISYTSNNGANWNNTYGIPTSQTIYSLAINNNDGFAGGVNAIYKSTNGGLNWSSTSFSKTVYSLVISSGVVYAGTQRDGIYYSANNGANWIQLGLAGKTVRFIKVVGSTIYAATDTTGIYYTTDYGISWLSLTPLPISNSNIYSLQIIGTNFLVGIDNYSVLLSTNNGISWVTKLFGRVKTNSIAATTGILFAGTEYNGVYKSTNQGSNWVLTTLQRIKAKVIYIVNPNTILVGTTDGSTHFRSTNGGSNWTTMYIPGTVKAFHTVSSDKILAGTSNNIYISTNNGSSWNSIFTTGANCFTTLNGILFAGTTNGIYFSTNQGLNWVQRALPSLNVVSLAVSGNNLYAGLLRTSSGQPCLYMSSNNGFTWSEIALPPNQSIEGVTKILFNGNYMFIVAKSPWQDRVYMSPDGGNNWYNKNQGMPVSSNLVIEDFTGSEGNFYIGLNVSGVSTGTGVWKRSITESISIRREAQLIPTDYFMEQNFPNPFNSSSVIRFGVPKTSHIKIKLYDITGKVISVIFDNKLSEGIYTINVDAIYLSTGIYFYELVGPDFRNVRKMVVLK